MTETGRPGVGKSRVDLSGTVPDDVRVDPDLTEGRPGYQDSADSEIVPSERVVRNPRTKST